MLDPIDSDSLAQDQLKSFVRRIEAIEDEIKVLNDDKSEIYREAKGNGFDVKVLRKVVTARRKGQAERDEEEALFDLYWNAIHGVVRAHVENIEEFASEEARPQVSYQDPSVDAEGLGGAVHEAGREEGFQSRLPSDRAENKPDAPAVIAGVPFQTPDDGGDTAEPDSGLAVQGEVATLSPETAGEVLAQDGGGSLEGKSEAALTASVDAIVNDGDRRVVSGNGIVTAGETAPISANHEATDKPGVEQSAPAPVAAIQRKVRHNADPRCLDKDKCGEFSNFAFCMKCRAAWRAAHPLETEGAA